MADVRFIARLSEIGWHVWDRNNQAVQMTCIDREDAIRHRDALEASLCPICKDRRFYEQTILGCIVKVACDCQKGA